MRRWFGAVLAMIVVLGALTAAPAVAQVTIGQTPSSPPSPLYCVNSPFDAIQFSHVSGPGYVVPAPGGALTSWSTFAGEGPGQQLTFKV